MNDILYLKLDDIRPPSVIMMQVDTQSISYMELRDSIKDEGILQNLTVKLCEDPNYKYELVTGLHRYTVAKELDMILVPCMLVEAPDSEMIIKQIQENCCRKQPSNIQLSYHFKRLLMLQPELTYGDLAGLVHKSPLWVRDILTLQELTPAAKRLMEDNVISLVPALVLTKLPKTIQDDLIDDAIDLTPQEFLIKCRQTKKRYREAVTQGILMELEDLYTKAPDPELRRFPDIKQEYRECVHGRSFLEDNPDIEPIEIWKSAIAWVIQLDTNSVAEYYVKQQLMEEKKRKRLASNTITQKAKKAVKNLQVKLDSVTLRLAQEFIF